MRYPKKLIVVALLLMAGLGAHAQTQPKAPADEPKPGASDPQSAKAPDSGAAALPDSTTLQLVSGVKAVYPPQAREKQLQGRVVLKLLISETGDVESTEAVSGNEVLVPAAMDAAKKWKFKPYIRNGKAVKVSTKIPFDFAFQGNVVDDPQSKTIDPSLPQAGSSEQTGPSRVRVSQGVSQGQLVHHVNPVYPSAAKTNHIQGEVLLQAIIGKSGRVENLSVVRGHPVLAEAAMDAVKQWRYKPYLLKGEPVEVETTIRITFHM